MDTGTWITFGAKQQWKTLVSDDKIAGLDNKRLRLTTGSYVQVYTNQKWMMLSHFVAGSPPEGFVKDHINRDRIDNRTTNLRDVSFSVNALNRTKYITAKTSSQYKGVSKHQKRNRWLVHVSKHPLHFCGWMNSEVEAAKLYDSVIWRYYQNDVTLDMTNNLLSSEEILHAKNTDPPKSTFAKKQSEIPVGITRDHNSFRVRVSQRCFSCKTLEEAKNLLKTLKKKQDTDKKDAHFSKPVTYNFDGEAIIQCGKNTQSKMAIVDCHLWHELTQHQWYVNRWGYAAGRHNGKTTLLHRLIWQLLHPTDTISQNMCLDHIDNNRLNCKSSNLRVVSRAVNARNKRKREGSTSRYRGVCWNSQCQKWQASISVQTRTKYLGLFETEELALAAYETASHLADNHPVSH